MMNNSMEGIINQKSEISETFLMKNIENSGCRLIESLEKNIAIIRSEARQFTNTNSQMEAKLRYFNELSNCLTCKLQSLVTLSEHGFGNRQEIKDFVKQITLSWVHANKKVVKKYAGARIESSTVTRTPLTTILNKIKKEATAVKVSLQIGSVIYDQDCVSHGYRIYNEILKIFASLERCDDKVQQFLVLRKTTPYLVKLSQTIDRFVETTDLLPQTRRGNDTKEDFAAFHFVTKLLTGELLGEEPTNPLQILAENAPRKPVFITLNNKRKMDIPKITRTKIFRSSSFPSALILK